MLERLQIFMQNEIKYDKISVLGIYSIFAGNQPFESQVKLH